MNQSVTSSNKNWPKLLQSPLTLGLLFLLLANFILLRTQPFARIDPESLPAAHTWVWWATREYLEQKSAPDVVLLGSSLMMHPVSRLDANYLHQDLDYVHHHRSVYMSGQLESKLGVNNPLCFNFALPGGMASDDYIVSRALFSPQRKPKLVILGLSLRDFIDSGVHCAGATPAFRYLKQFTSVDDLVDISMPQFWQRFDYWCGKYIYLWGKKLDIQVYLSEQSKKLLKPVLSKLCTGSKLNDLDLSKNLPSNLRSEVEEGMFVVKANQPYSFDDNSAEYRKRYISANQPLFVIQSKFLDKTLQLYKKNGIAVAIVNMPLTTANLALMPAGSYQRYIHTLQQASQQYHCKFVDLNAGTNFVKTDFYDTSHMNADGGKKLMDALVFTIKGDRQLASSLSNQVRELAAHGSAL